MNKKYVLFGFLSPVTALVFISAAVYIHDFSFTGTALSDMGRIGLEKNYIFNVGLILSSVFGLLFSLSLYTALKGYERIPALGFTTAALSLIGIGVFPEGLALHVFFSVGFYLLALFSILIIGVLVYRRKKNLGVFSVSSFGAACILVGIPGWNGVAIPEVIGAFFICLWMMVISYSMWTDNL
ncbi:MAG: DUF998 domain-containing protein [Theionarchaea archaeon]|nr:DUF998 domain-containing protein [Theionarchaea archaeon]